jgi:hypothetical protein
VEEKIQREQRQKQEQLEQQLIKDYQTQNKNKKLQKELRATETVQFEDLKNE